MQKNNSTTIKPRKGVLSIDLRELWQYKELLWTLALKEIKVRYKQTLIGGMWAVLQPFLTMVVFTIFFGQMIKIPTDNIPYAVFSYSGLLLWTFFSNSLTLASSSTISNQQLISKMYFPRIIIPISTTIVGLIDYLIAFVIIFGIMFYYKFPPSAMIFLLPITVFFTWLLTSGLGFFFSAFNVKYRDVRYVIPFITRILIFVTPVIYPISISGNFKWLLIMNPMTGLIEAHRSMILGHQPVDWQLLGISIALTIIIFFAGLIYFKRTERYFADII